MQRSILFDLDPTRRAHISPDASVNHHFPRDDIRHHVGADKHRDFGLFELTQAFDRTINLEVLLAGDLPFDVQSLFDQLS